MSDNARDFKGVWIPREIWLDSKLILVEKFYLSIYQQFNENMVETDMEMRKNFSVSTICSIKKSLIKKGLIKKVKDSEYAKSLVIERKGQGKKCEWCGHTTFALQQHHFPIPKSKGGTQTVLICPNCHYEYHLIIKNMED